ncbi:MAG: ABC transporter substrate-binding protein [Nitrospinota bacterium]|nr:ABC transporter substrate-binding protein [Nitrospinota bacterium]
MKRPQILHLFAILTLFGLVGPTPDSALADSPKAAVQQLLQSIKQVHHQKPLTPEQQHSNDQASSQALSLMDVRQVSQKTLGKYWKERNQKEQEDFVQLLGGLFRYVAFPNSSKFFGEMHIDYADTQMEGTTATVPLTVQHPDEGAVGIDFVLEQNSARWRVVDVILDGVSMRNNLRTQFYKVIKKNDYAELLRRMQKKLNDAKK